MNSHSPGVESGSDKGPIRIPESVRETRDVESEPEIAAALFGDNIDQARTFARELARQGEELGLIGPLEPPRLWTRHIINCALIAPLLSHGRIADVGSGAGLPGIVLAIARPDVTMVLIEPMERRIQWLEFVVSTLALANVDVVRARAQEATSLSPFDQVTARAVTSLNKLIPMTAPLVKRGGELLFLKGEGVFREWDAAAKAIAKARLSDVEVLMLGEEMGTEATRVFRAKVD